MRWLIGLFLLLALAACSESASTSTIDFCGVDMDTEATLTEVFNKGRTEAVEDWLVEELEYPGRVRECLPNKVPRTVQIRYFRLYRVGDDGQPSSTIREWGFIPAEHEEIDIHSQINIYADTLASNEVFGYEMYGELVVENP